MSEGGPDPYRRAMPLILKNVTWPLVIGLGVLALIRPLVRIVADQSGVTLGAVVPIALTVAISVVWIAVVGFSSVRHPVATLVLAALTYGVLSILLSGVLSPILTGELAGPLAMPIAIVPALLFDVVWGAVTGLIAAAIQRARGIRSGAAR